MEKELYKNFETSGINTDKPIVIDVSTRTLADTNKELAKKMIKV